MQFYPQTKEVSGANSISTYYNRIYTDNQQQIEQDGFVKVKFS
jgi:hypothetical protein